MIQHLYLTHIQAQAQLLNVDTGGLAFFTKPDHIGYVKKGMNLVNADGDAEATVSDLSLVQ